MGIVALAGEMAIAVRVTLVPPLTVMAGRLNW